MQTLLLIDFSAVYSAAWHSQGADEGPGAASTRCVNRVRAIAERNLYDFAVICCDDSRNWRHDIYSGYKANREAKPEGFREQLRDARKTLERDFPVGFASNYEADDIIATLARAWERGNRGQVLIATHDKDIYQLINDNVRIANIRETDGAPHDEAFTREKFGVTPNQLGDLLALVGDTSDNVPGIDGVGKTTASKLLNRFQDIAGICEAIHATNAAELFKPKLLEKLIESEEQLHVSRKLVALCDTAPIALPWEQQPTTAPELEPALEPANEAPVSTDVPVPISVSATEPVARLQVVPQPPQPIEERSTMSEQANTNNAQQQPARAQQTATPAARPASRFASARVGSGVVRTAAKNIITGRPGIGKTRFLSTLPNVWIIDLEDGLLGASQDHQFGYFEDELGKVIIPRTLREFMDALDEFAINRNAMMNGKRPFANLAIDGLTGIERLVHEAVMGKEKAEHMEAKEHKKLWAMAEPVMATVQRKIDSIRETGVNIWIAAHASEVHESSNTTGENYKKWDILMKGSFDTGVNARNFWRQWANNVFFMEWDVIVRKGGKGRRAIGENRARILYTQETGTHYAKTRERLPPIIPADWQDLSRAMMADNGNAKEIEKLLAKIERLASKLDEEKRQAIMAYAGKCNTVSALQAALNRVEALISIDESENASEATEEQASQPQESLVA